MGGNAGGAVVKNTSLGTTGNSIVGAIGGLVLGQILERMTGARGSGHRSSGGEQHGLHYHDVIGGGAGGAILTVIAGLIKNSMSKA